MRLNIDLKDTLTLRRSGISGADIRQVGESPVWEDDSDETYVDVVGKYFGPGQPQASSQAIGEVAPQTFAGKSRIVGNEPGLLLRIDIRLRAVQAGLPFPRVRWTKQGGFPSFSPTNAPTLAPNTPTTVTLEMSGYEGTWLTPDQFYVDVRAPGINPAPGSYPTGRADRNWYIYEVRPHWYIPSGAAPPCRLWQRGDRYDLSGARVYPPPKSRQFSSRGRGMY